MKRQHKPQYYMKVDEVDRFGYRLAEAIRQAMAVCGHEPRLLPQLQKLEVQVAKAQVDFSKAISRGNDTLAARNAQTMIAAKEQLEALMQGPNRLDIDLNIEF